MFEKIADIVFTEKDTNALGNALNACLLYTSDAADE